MSLHVRDAGTWKEVTDPQVRDGGTWKPIQEGYVRDAGTWKLFYSAEPSIVLPSAATISQSDTSTLSSYAGVQFNASGQLQYVNGQNLSWLDHLTGWMDPQDAAKASLFEVRFTKTGGSVNGLGMTSGVWYNMGTTRNKYVAQTTVGSNNLIGTFDIRRASDSTILATVTGVEFIAFRTS